MTLERLSYIKKTNKPIVICNEENRFITAEQIRELNFQVSSIVLEPSRRDTAPAIAIAAIKCLQENEDALLLTMPSDHKILDDLSFAKTIEYAKKYALDDYIVTFGVNPTTPETGYGYIKSKTPIHHGELTFAKIEDFIEKPKKEIAKEFIKDKSFSWNSGIFLFKASTIVNQITKFSPDIIKFCKKSLENKVDDLDFERINKFYFENCPNISIDKAVLEKTNKGIVVPLLAGWNDVGSWESYLGNLNKDHKGNILVGNSIEINSKNSLVQSNNRLVVVQGIEDLIVVETKDAVLVINKKESEKIKDLVNYLKEKNISEAEGHQTIFRPWGNFITIENNSMWKVKKIEVKPYSSLSLQLHKQRSEHWIIVEGIANVEIDNDKFILKENQSCYVPIKSKHRLSNPYEKKLIIIEVQIGKYLGEDDILRFNDLYGRK